MPRKEETDAFLMQYLTPCAVVVDDDKDSADTVAMVLELGGIDVRVAYSASDGLMLVRRHRPAAVVTDLDMPHMDGLDEARALRSMPEGRDVCLIALTGSVDMERRARAAGFDHFLLKPGNISHLTAIVTAACGAHEHRDAGTTSR
ncbi:response regulator [Rhizobacter sp. LjRoot28]|uniref:response regulator n=1 Tax=Rhizobacter sp. LjRoot28 TaxID=3342309 RepID=UPI003ECF9F56